MYIIMINAVNIIINPLTPEFRGWLRSTVEERRLFPGELSCPALDLQLTGDHLCG